MAVDLTKLIDFNLLQRYDTKLKAWAEKKIVESNEIIFTTENSLPATGNMNLLYVTEDSIFLWDGSKYIKVGGQGTGTTFIPSIDANGDLTFTNDGGLPNPAPVNVRGPAGKSAYDIAVENGFTGDKKAWLESLKGEDGTIGEDGKSAYDLAVDAGFTGSEADWLESLKGKDGTNGASFTIKGLYATYDDLIDAHPTGEAGDAYAVGDSDYNEIYNWSVDKEEWENLGSLEGPPGPKGEDSTIPGPQGKSAYQIALDNGFEGTEEEWLDSLSADGIQIKIVNELPETGEEKILYFLPIDDGTHEEYMWIAEKWEMIGTTKVDLSDYYTKQQIDELIPDVIKRCVWIYSAGNDISLFAENSTNVASFTEFIGCKPAISNNNIGLILVDNKLYWTKFNITAINESTDAAYQEFTQDPILIGPTDTKELITIEDTVVTNISQIPMDKLPCCLHMVNSEFGFAFNDDVIYATTAGNIIKVYTMNGMIREMTYNDSGVISIGNIEMVATTNYVDNVITNYYNKSQIDEKLEEIELTPGEKGDDGPSIVSMRFNENLHLISTLSNGIEIDAGKIDVDGLTIEKTEVIDVKLMTDEIAFDGETTEFTLPVDSKTLMVYVNGLCLENGSDYTINEGTITFSEVFSETDKGILHWFDKNSTDSEDTLWATRDDIDGMFE